MARILDHDTAAPAAPAAQRDRQARGAEPRRSLLASSWFWAGGLLSLAAWVALYLVAVR